MDESVPRHVEADQRKIRQVLINLLGNAIKFTRQGAVRTRASAVPSDDEFILIFEVEDTGPGIGAEDQKRIFEAFAQSDSGSATEGTGLGLTISRRFVQLMGGEIEVRSEPGRGSCFRFSIRAMPVTASVVPPAPNPIRIARLIPDERTHRVLVVDDNDDNRAFLRILLRDVGFDVVEARSGREAIERCAKLALDAVLMDLRMPLMDGYETTRRSGASAGSWL
ncbi:MAG: ATP-binding protein [Myxococcota bacterium]